MNSFDLVSSSVYATCRNKSFTSASTVPVLLHKHQVQQESFEAEVVRLRRENANLRSELQIAKTSASHQVQAMRTQLGNVIERIGKFALSFNEALASMEAAITSVSEPPAVFQQLSPNQPCPKNSSGSSILSCSSLITIGSSGKARDEEAESGGILVVPDCPLLPSKDGYPASSKLGTVFQQLAMMNNCGAGTAASKRQKESGSEELERKLEEKNRDVERHKLFIRKLKSAIQTLMQENSIAKTLACHGEFA